MNISLRAKLLLLGVAFPVLITVLLLIGYAWQQTVVSREDAVIKARAVTLVADAARDDMEDKWKAGTISPVLMAQWGKELQAARAAGDTATAKLLQERILGGVPVVSALRAISAHAEEGGYQLKVPKVSPRRPSNEPTPEEREILTRLEGGLPDYSFYDAKQNAVRYFRPVKLSENCLFCHGDPKNPAHNIWGTTDGKDITGGTMENWKVGEVHGAFELTMSMEASDAQRRRSLLWAGGAALAILFLAAGSAALFARRAVERPIVAICERLAAGADQLRQASGQVSNLSQELAAGASRQAGSLADATANISGLATTAAENLAGSGEVERQAQEASRSAQQGRELTATVAQALRVKLESLTKAVSDVANATERTAQVVSTIDDIAFQTNLLALNAAVEAARAGEAGAGFAVVADEVRSLAVRCSEEVQRSTQQMEEARVAMRQIAAVSSEVDRSIRQAVEQDFAKGFGDAATATHKVAERMAGINAASTTQSQSLQQLSASVADLDQVTQANAASAEESAASSEELNAQAMELRHQLDKLLQLIQGNRPG